MKKLAALSLLAMSLGSTYAQEEVISYTDDAIVVDLQLACWSRGKIKSCDLNEYGINAVISAQSSSKNSADVYEYYDVDSSVQIKRIDYRTLYYSSGSYYTNKWVGGFLSSDGGYQSGRSSIFTQSFEGSGITKLVFHPAYSGVINKLYFNNGIPTSLNASLSTATSILRGSYKGVERNLNSFRNEIAKSHRGHLDRFTEALNTGIALTEAKDSKTGRPLYSIVDWRIQENARLIVVFGTVLNELLTDYDDVQRLRNSISAMRTLVEQLRMSYGWQRGLAGTVSKASSSLIDVVRLELQELASIKIAMGSSDFQIYTEMLKVTRSLQAKVDASRSGDMRTQREIFGFVDLWNSKAWQDEMGRLMNAGPDFKNLVVPKLSMLLFAIESIADLSEQDFVIPDRKELNK